MKRNFFSKLVLTFFLFLIKPSAMAISSQSTSHSQPSPATDSVSLGNVAGNVFDIEMNVHEILKAVCLVSASALFLSALIKYKKHRSNPIEVPLSAAITNLIIALVLVVLAFIPLQI